SDQLPLLSPKILFSNGSKAKVATKQGWLKKSSKWKPLLDRSQLSLVLLDRPAPKKRRRDEETAEEDYEHDMEPELRTPSSSGAA
ncbi:MAG: hypothetical protein Q9183_006852, partial [Haloplaca sp. 2 TL-2023]